MSVLMKLVMDGDPKKLEELAGQSQDTLVGIAEHAKEHGLIAHRFYGSDDGQIMIIDEWPDPQSFQEFFEHMRPQIEPLMQQVATSEPVISFWRKLETGDDVGWES